MAKEAIGTTYREFPTNPGGEFWRIEPKAGLSETATIEAFKKAGWTPYRNYNPEHAGGSDYEKYYDGAWYHLTIAHGVGYQYVHIMGSSVPQRARRVFGDRFTPPWITVHCELNFRPSSPEHFKDHVKRKFGIHIDELIKQMLLPWST
jgi:hypothetical protein